MVDFFFEKIMEKLVFVCCILCLFTSVFGQNYTFKTYFYEQQIDHFSFLNNDKYLQRYLIADQYWNRNSSGPIFFYTGNEGDIVLFAENTGFMWDIAPEFGALLVFAEHRYYGVSQPFGNLSYSNIEYLGYLSSEQALADFAQLITYLKKTIAGAESAPVIAFGGSYGGMLSAWGRMKYPHIFKGAIASSAPILQFTGITPCTAFNQIVTKVFKSASNQCSDNIRKTWDAMDNCSQTDGGRQWLTNNFHLCSPLKDGDVGILKDWFGDLYGNLAMINYPYPADFLEPLPAWPVKAACTYISGTYTSDEELLEALSKVASFYFNYTGQSPCIDIDQQATSELGDLGWNFQACSEMVMPMCSDGVTDMFQPSPWNFTDFAETCKETFNVTSHEYMAQTVYGGRDISAASNIVFSNGQLDPWSGGGVLESVSDTLVAVLIEDGAHHLDLRGSNPADPQSVIRAREIEKSYIWTWITEPSQRNPQKAKIHNNKRRQNRNHNKIKKLTNSVTN